MSTREELIAANPHLTPNDGTQDSLRLGAKNLRADLKHEGISALVKSKRFAGGNSLDVYVENPQQLDEAREVAKKYQNRSYDSYNETTSSTHSNWHEVFGSTSYALTDIARGDDLEKLRGTYKAPAKKEMSLEEKRRRFFTGIERGTESTVSRYIDSVKDDPEQLKAALEKCARNVHKHQSYSIFTTLVEQGGLDPNTQIGKGKHTALHYCAGASASDASQRLIEAGADVNARDAEGNTPLHHVWREDIAQLLIDAGADVLAQNEHGLLPAQREEGVYHRRADKLIHTAQNRARLKNIAQKTQGQDTDLATPEEALAMRRSKYGRAM